MSLRASLLLVLGTCLLAVTPALSAQEAAAAHGTQVIILGTGTPVPDARRAGPGVAVVVNGEAYVFDAGGGMAQRAIEAAERYDLPALLPQDIEYLFITHLHSDHIHDVAELASARWWARQARLKLFGPHGSAEYARYMTEMNAVEARIRTAGTPAQLITDAEGYTPEVTEIEDGVVFENDDIRVEAFTVPHGDIRPAFGYKITTTDRSIVISGDTTYSPALAEMAKGVDLLIHEVISGDHLAQLSEFWQDYHGSSHTTTQQLAQVANTARPGLLVLYHILFLEADAEDIVAQVKRDYDGEVVLAEDLDRF